MSSPWNRIDFLDTPNELVSSIARLFSLGQVISFDAITKGVIEVNIKVSTSSNIYVIKIFSNKRLPRVKDILQTHIQFSQNGIPVPQLIHSREGKSYFIVYSKSGQRFYGCVIKWFEGTDFSSTEPTTDDLQAISRTLAEIHFTTISIKEIYDDCFPINLAREYKKKKNLVDERYKSRIEEIATKCNSIDVVNLKHGVIHGDLSREHILRDTNGNICVLDLGAVNLNPQVIDLAFAMSYFCLDLENPTPKNFLSRYNIMLKEYIKHRTIPQLEIRTLPTYIEANYAMCYMIGKYFRAVFQEDLAQYLIDFGELGLIGKSKQSAKI